MKKKLSLQLLLLTLVSVSFAQGVDFEVGKKFDRLYKGARLYLKKDLDSAYIMALQASALAQNKHNNYKVNYILGYISNQRKWYNKSVLYYSKALKFATEKQVYSLKNNIADNYYEIGDLDASLSVIQEVKRYRVRNSSEKLYLSFGIIAKVFGRKGLVDSAVFYFDKAIKEVVKYQKGKVTSHVSGLLVAKAKMYDNAGLTMQAIKVYKKSLGYEMFVHKRGEIVISLAEMFVKLKDYASAERCIAQVEGMRLNNLYCNINLLKVKGLLAYKEGGFSDAKELYLSLDSVLRVNRGVLIKKDERFYLSLKADLQGKILGLYEKVEARAAVRGWGLVVLSFIGFMLILALVFRKQPDLQKHSSKSAPSGLSVAYRSSENRSDKAVLKKVDDMLDAWRRSNGSPGTGLN